MDCLSLRSISGFDLIERNFFEIALLVFVFDFDYGKLRVLGGFLYLSVAGCAQFVDGYTTHFAGDIWVMKEYKVQSS